MDPNSTQFTDQLANVDPKWVIGIVLLITIVRIALARNKEAWARTVSETCDTVNFVLILAFLLIRPFVAQAFYIPSESMEYTLLKKDRLIVDKFSYRLRDPAAKEVVVFEAPPEAMDGQESPVPVDYIKRLVAKGGDTVQVKAARIVVDGEALGPQEMNYMGTHDYLRDRLGIPDEVSVKLFRDHLLVNGKERVDLKLLAEKLNRPGSRVELVPGQTLINGVPQDEPYTREDPDYDYPEGGTPLRLEPDRLFMLGDNRNRSKDSHVWGPLERRRVVGRAVVIFWPPARAGAIR